MIAALLFVLAANAQATAAVFESELWPGEGIPVFVAVAASLSLHETPDSTSKVLRRLTVKPKQQLIFDETRYRTIQPGRITALVSTTIEGRLLGDITKLSKADYYSARFPDTTVTVGKGDQFELLQYRAEGTCFIRVAGRTLDADCPMQGEQFRLHVEPKTEWWIRIAVKGKPVGWLLVSPASVRVADRRG